MSRYAIIHTFGVGRVKCQMEFEGDDEAKVQGAAREAAAIYERAEAKAIRAALAHTIHACRGLDNEVALHTQEIKL